MAAFMAGSWASAGAALVPASVAGEGDASGAHTPSAADTPVAARTPACHVPAGGLGGCVTGSAARTLPIRSSILQVSGRLLVID